ncbi:MAG TPA: peptidylprolyl isomerase [Gemmatimonadaceae bacterium]|nr:peptidylprolyl isomerase [Gemmatimonadaceae bacterium]
MMRTRTTLAALAGALALAGAARLGAQQAPPQVGTVDGVIAIVGSTPILRTDLEERIVAMRAGGVQLPEDSAGQFKMMQDILNQLIDEELILQKAKEYKIEVSDNDVSPQVDKQIQQIRSRFNTELEYRVELKKAGFGTPDEYRRFLLDAAKRQQLQQKVVEKLREEKKLPMVPVTDAEVDSFFKAGKGQMQRLPATVTLRQIVIAPWPSPKADSQAYYKADSIYQEIKKGGDFDLIAKRESQDPGTKELGGDLGWRRRGDFVPMFDAVYFSLLPGQVSPPFRTPFGWHIVRVDKVKPGEVKGRHILIRAKIDSADIKRARLQADSVMTLWRAGVKFDTLAVRYHDPTEEKAILMPFPQSQLPVEYQKAIAGHKPGDVLAPFTMQDKQRDVPKFFVVELVTLDGERDPSAADFKDKIRDSLQQEKSIRHYLDQLRAQSFVVVRLT